LTCLIYIIEVNTLDIPTHDTHQGLLLQFLVLLLMIAESVQKIYSVNAFVSKKQYCPKMHLVGSLYIIDLNWKYIGHKAYFLQEGKQSVMCFLFWCRITSLFSGGRAAKSVTSQRGLLSVRSKMASIRYHGNAW